MSKCPECKTVLGCWCESCKMRYPEYELRWLPIVFDATDEESFVRCPSCKSVFSLDYLEDIDNQQYLKQQKILYTDCTYCDPKDIDPGKHPGYCEHCDGTQKVLIEPTIEIIRELINENVILELKLKRAQKIIERD